MSGRNHNTKAEPGFIKRRNRINEAFSIRTIGMLESPAYRVLSQSALRIIARVELELCSHGGNDNGSLPITYEDFEAYGINHNAIAPAIREAEALGFIRVTEHGRAGNAEYRRPNKFYITFPFHRGGTPTNEWQNIKTMEEAQQLARLSRNNKSPQAVRFAERRALKTKSHTRKAGAAPHPESGSETAKPSPPDSDTTGVLRNPIRLSIFRVGGAFPPVLSSTRPYAGYSSLPIELRLLALGLGPSRGASCQKSALARNLSP